MSPLIGCSQHVHHLVVNSPIGRIIIEACSYGLHRISCDEQKDPDPAIKVCIESHFDSKNIKAINETINWLEAYFELNKDLKNIASPQLCPQQNYNSFYQKVWLTLQNETNPGDKISYSELAQLSCGKSTASRAVGTAMKNNPFILVIPCHRVIKKNGIIGNYSGGKGKNTKNWLLSHETHFNKC